VSLTAHCLTDRARCSQAERASSFLQAQRCSSEQLFPACQPFDVVQNPARHICTHLSFPTLWQPTYLFHSLTITGFVLHDSGSATLRTRQSHVVVPPCYPYRRPISISPRSILPVTEKRWCRGLSLHRPDARLKVVFQAWHPTTYDQTRWPNKSTPPTTPSLDTTSAHLNLNLAPPASSPLTHSTNPSKKEQCDSQTGPPRREDWAPRSGTLDMLPLTEARLSL
jgi:hypothetical protein